MASNDSGVETSNDSNDIFITNPPISFQNLFEHSNKQLEGFAFPEPIIPIDNTYRNPTCPTTIPVSNRDIEKRKTMPEKYPMPTTGKNYITIRVYSRKQARLKGGIPQILSMSRERRLRLAASTCNVELLTRLLETGTNPDCFDEHQRSSLHLAACRGYTDIVSQLLKFGANPNIIDSLGNTPLHLAVISASTNNFNLVVRILLKHGANVHLLDRTGKNPLELAESKLRLMRARYKNPTKETKELCVLIALILRQYCKEKEDIDELSVLEERLKNLNTNDNAVVSEADSLLASVERLSINK